jgi:hypothetical protein
VIYLAYAVFLLVYWFCPKKVQLAILIINIFIPDRIPYIDEIIMVIGLLKGGS